MRTYTGRGPTTAQSPVLLSTFDISDGFLWHLTARLAAASPRWLPLKLWAGTFQHESAHRVPFKANYWLAYDVSALRSSITADHGKLRAHRPALYEALDWFLLSIPKLSHARLAAKLSGLPAHYENSCTGPEG